MEKKTKKKREFTVPIEVYSYIQNYALENNGLSTRSIDSVDGEITAYIDMDVVVSLKYAIQLYVWKDEGEEIKDYTIWKEVSPSDGHFLEFKDCIMGKLERMAFGSEG